MFDIIVIFLFFLTSVFAFYITESLPHLVFSELTLKKKCISFWLNLFQLNPRKIIRKQNAFIIFLTTFILFVIYKFSSFDRRVLFILFFAWATLILVFIDQKHYILPDIITIPMIWLGILLNMHPYTRTVGIKESLFGAILGYALFRLFADLYFYLRKKEGLGRGDVKFIAMVGAWLGAVALPLIIFMASAFFVIWHSFFVPNKHNLAYPFGPFIGFSVIGYLIFNLYLLKNGVVFS